VAFAEDPITRLRIPLEVTVLVSIAPLEEFEKRVAESRVHANSFAWVIAANTVAGKTLLEEGFVICAAAVELACGGHAGRERAALATGVVPCAEGVSGAV
jgi:hypothetical protein